MSVPLRISRDMHHTMQSLVQGIAKLLLDGKPWKEQESTWKSVLEPKGGMSARRLAGSRGGSTPVAPGRAAPGKPEVCVPGRPLQGLPCSDVPITGTWAHPFPAA